MQRARRSKSRIATTVVLVAALAACSKDQPAATPSSSSTLPPSTTTTPAAVIPRDGPLPDPPCLLSLEEAKHITGLTLRAGVAAAALPHVCTYQYGITDVNGQIKPVSGVTITNRVDITDPQQTLVRFSFGRDWKAEQQPIALGSTGTLFEGAYVSAVTMTRAGELQTAFRAVSGTPTDQDRAVALDLLRTAVTKMG